MTEQTLPPDPVPPVVVEPVASLPRPKFSVADFFAQVSIAQMSMVLIVLVFAWQWFDVHQTMNGMQQELAKKIAEMDGTSKANQLLLSHSREDVRQLSGKLLTLETRYAEAQNQRAALETLYNDLSSSRDETALAEVEQLLMIANQQLQLSANVKTALIALQSADARLERMNRVNLEPVRKSIGRDIERLRASPDVDLPGMGYDLDRMIEAVDKLPLVSQPTQSVNKTKVGGVADTQDSLWRKLLREVWQELRQLIRVEDTRKASIPLLPPEQEFFLRENLKLHLLTARLALLSRDEKTFKQEMSVVQRWSNQHFDTNRVETQDWLSLHAKLAIKTLHIELPDLSPSLQLVRDYRLSREKGLR